MQPSQLEIQREVEALRDIRRRSTAQGGPGALILDPDLPNPSSPTSPTSTYWSAAATQQLADGDSSSGSHEDSGSSEERIVASEDPSHLFWVPARLHPEIAPAEFRNLLKEHARTPPPEGSTTVDRANSFGHDSSGLERRRSMLSRQYKPSENDDVEEETIVPIQRRRSTLAHPGPQLTISDLQRLEELAEEASKSDDPSRFRAVIRRSLSLNMAPSAIDKIDSIADIHDEADAPIIIPPRGQILRRAARTKIRKSGQPGEGAPHRFGPGRRHRAATAAEPRTSSDLSSNDHTPNDPGDNPEQLMRPRAFSAENVIANDVQASKRPDSFSEETSIYDAYVREDADLDLTQFASSIVSPSPALSLSLSTEAQEPHAPSEIEEVPMQPPIPSPTPVPELQHPQPQRLPAATPADEITRIGSPDTVTLTPSTEETLVPIPSVESFASTKSSSKKDKDKKGLFGKWGSDKSAKKSGKDRDREKDTQREKESGFFGSLFGKRKQDEGQAGSGYGTPGRETAATLLGASKSSKSCAPSPSPQPGPMGYARYPIHVERAIYRLSHIKLANPRRPLYEQVLISNLMFWYLGVINKTQNPAPTQGSQTQSAATPVQSSSEKEHTEQEGCETEEQQRPEGERVEKERQDQERAKEVQPQQQKKDSRRGALTKAAPGQPGGRRTAEMPVKGPQYEMQHRVMEQEYNAPGYSYGASGGGGARVHRQPSPPVHSQPMIQPDPSTYAYTGYGYGDGDLQYMAQGGVQSMALDPSWSPVNPGSPPMSNTPSSQLPQNGPVHPEAVVAPAPQPRSRSPPSQNHNRYAPVATAPGRPQVVKGPGRSLSATVVTSRPVSPDVRPRKATSARVTSSAANGQLPAGVGSPQEEDVPLAVWQQQRRR
ncbi:hypothetical protein BKA83DRAFT_4267463 [Pisolithus microcarpus]|nr:hypothetical protein BKA83DRAFT_4267463 [Pisolithus microcarpus]